MIKYNSQKGNIQKILTNTGINSIAIIEYPIAIESEPPKYFVWQYAVCAAPYKDNNINETDKNISNTIIVKNMCPELILVNPLVCVFIGLTKNSFLFKIA